LNATVTCRLAAGTATKKGKLSLLFLWSDTLTHIGKTLQRLVVRRAVPARSRDVIVAFNFISKRTVQSAEIKFLESHFGFCKKQIKLFNISRNGKILVMVLYLHVRLILPHATFIYGKI
jgi:hypothetical protein